MALEQGGILQFSLPNLDVSGSGKVSRAESLFRLSQTPDFNASQCLEPLGNTRPHHKNSN